MSEKIKKEKMKIAIHHRKGSFSDRWISYCEREKISYKIVNCFDSNIIEQLHGCNGLMWHHHHGHYKDVLLAKKILFALEHAGIPVFPDFRTEWHFDDKVAQKYLLEALGAPLVPSYVFYDKTEALKWAHLTTFPKVFKLKGGAGSKNVVLVQNLASCKRIIKKSFGNGFSQSNVKNAIKDDILRFRKTKKPINILKAIARPIIRPEFAKLQSKEKGYAYFQEFVPGNTFDIRVIVIGDKAFALKRIVRENDFRASGSGKIIYDKGQINIECVKIAFDVNTKIGAQSIAYDFVFDEEKKPLIVEISYGFAPAAYDLCEGYWDSTLQWHEVEFNPQEWMVADFLKSLKSAEKGSSSEC